jgi:flagellar protein FliS
VSTALDYLETQVLTATPQRLHLMVVDAALRSARRGLEALHQQQWEAMDAAFSHSRECVAELIAGLKPDQSPELVARLKALFLYVFRNLTEGDLLRDAARIQAALQVLERHRETWLELGGVLARQSAAAAPAPHARSWIG